jgi:hypothetical protein
MTAKAKSKAKKPKQEEASVYTDVSEGAFTVRIPRRGEVSLPETWTRTYHACGTVHSIVNKQVAASSHLNEDGTEARSVTYDTFDSTSGDPDMPTRTEIVQTTPKEGDKTATMFISRGPRCREYMRFRMTEEEDRLLVRRVLRGDMEEIWIFFDEPQGDALRVQSHSWREVDKDGKEIRLCLEVADGLVLHPPKFSVAQAGGDVRGPKDSKGKAARQAPGLRVDLIPDEGAAAKGKRAGKKDGRRPAGRVRKGRGRGDRVRA